jgi:hypothetical protein
MDMVRHEHVSVQSDPISQKSLVQAAKIELVILIREEAGIAIIPALDDVGGDAR